jgi:predicted RNA-binding Zn-ribbon protein involved in translation (DUF1610 family)
MTHYWFECINCDCLSLKSTNVSFPCPKCGSKMVCTARLTFELKDTSRDTDEQLTLC